jgi:UDP-N-acetylglucosamine--N-acetylmuramyl-(pentapeptide) pyrophosphoryl-undecaprenol N-acetylglucosamine transferase
MKIVLVGGGTGGHFYPLVAVAEAVGELCKERTLLEPELLYLGPEPFDRAALLEHDVIWEKSSAGRVRRYASILNVFDAFKTVFGIVQSLMQLYRIYPDVIFSTGGFAAFPTLYAAKVLKIPVVIYDADAEPGRVSLWASKFAHRIAVAHPDAATRFPHRVLDRIARVGHPIRKEIEVPAKEGGHEFLKLDPSVPTIFIMGGSQGASAINDALISALPALVEKYNVIHQAGRANVDEIGRLSKVVLEKSQHAERYRVFGLLNTLALKMAAGIATVIVARAGSGTIFEIASWGIPAILIPIPIDISHDQTGNAFSYARSGAAEVMEQRNLAPHLLIAEIDRLVADDATRAKMREAAQAFARPDAARKIAMMLLVTAIAHEPN